MFLNIFNIKGIKWTFSDIFNSYVDFETYLEWVNVIYGEDGTPLQ